MDLDAGRRQSWVHFFVSWLQSTGWAGLHGLMGILSTLLFAGIAIGVLELIVFFVPGLPHGFALASAVASGAFIGFFVFKIEREIPRETLEQLKVTKIGWLVLLLYGNAAIGLATLGGWLFLYLSGSITFALGVAVLYPAIDNWMARYFRFSLGAALVMLAFGIGLLIKELFDHGTKHGSKDAKSMLQDKWGPLTTQVHWNLQRKVGIFHPV